MSIYLCHCKAGTCTGSYSDSQKLWLAQSKQALSAASSGSGKHGVVTSLSPCHLANEPRLLLFFVALRFQGARFDPLSTLESLRRLAIVDPFHVYQTDWQARSRLFYSPAVNMSFWFHLASLMTGLIAGITAGLVDTLIIAGLSALALVLGTDRLQRLYRNATGLDTFQV